MRGEDCPGRPRAAPLVVLLATVLALAGCGAKPVADHSGDRDAPSDGGPPLDYGREEDSFEGLPGGALTYVLASPTAREAGSYLGEDDPLGREFRESAARQRDRLTLRGRRIAESLAEDAEARRIWDLAIHRLRVTRSRPKPDGSYDVVIQADLAPLFHHLTGE